MKRLGVIIVALWVGMGLSAAVRTTADALRIAGEFMSAGASGSSAQRSVSMGGPSGTAGLSVADSSAVYMAVNTASGFVLVGADDRLPEVLGYSDSGAFEADNMPPALRFWLQCYEEELEITNHQSPITNHQSASTPSIEPLCTTRWNQSAPYNNYAPAYNASGSRSVTGCVATAMAQVMKYHGHPRKGRGSHSYLWICTDPVGMSGTLSADFESTTYQWNQMLDNYRSGYTSEQADAVATLMYHCGVSVNMSYGQSSGAYTSNVPEALHTYFGYDGHYQRIQKVMYPADSLNTIIATELAARRPVLVSGNNDEGGHAFVCDGCDARGYFHINWGWGGSSDGYFLLTALNPGSQGIGGTGKGYNKSTMFFIGLQPEQQASPDPVPQMAAERIAVSSESFARSASFSASVTRLENFGLDDFSGAYGVALYDEDEKQLLSVLAQTSYSLKAGYHRTSDATLSGMTIPSSLPEGTYHLCFVYKNASYDWMRLLCTQDDYYRTLTLTKSQVTFYPNDAEPVLQLTAPISFGEGVNTDSVPYTGAPLSFAVQNSGGTFRGEISARIYKGAFSKGQYELMDEVVIRRNQTFSSALQQEFDANLLLATQYKMKLCWRADANDAWHDFEPAEYAVLPFQLYDPDYHLSLTDTIRFDNNDSVPRNNANLYYSIRNTGAPFQGELQLFFYEHVNSFTLSRGQSELREVTIGTNETLSDAFSGALEQPAGTYAVILRYRALDGEWEDFIDEYGENIGSIEATVIEDTPTGMEQTVSSPSPRISQKYLRDGRLLIFHDGRWYNAQGILLQ